jgi:hypothetical protein
MLCTLLHGLDIILLAGSWALAGYAILPRRARSADPLLIWSSSLALGAGLSAVGLTALAALHAFSRPAVVGVALTVATLALVGGRQALRSEVFSFRRQVLTWPERAALLLLAGVVVLTFVDTLAPPSSMDATVYHLRVPLEFLRAHSWAALEDQRTFQPLFVEMLFGEGIVLGGGILAALTHWALGLGAIVVAAAWGRRLGGGAIWAGVIFGATGLFVWESTSAFIDLGLTLFASLALFWGTRTERDVVPTVLAGVFAGLAAGSKFTGPIAASLTGLAGFAVLWPDWRRGLRRFFGIGALAMLIAAPWYARNLVFTGNPFYPLANHFWGLPPVPLVTETYGYGADALHLLTSPFDLLARGDPFDQGWSMGPAYLALVPVGVWALRRSKIAVVSAAVVVAWWIVWFVSSPQARLLLPVLPIAAGLASVGMRAVLDTSGRTLRWSAVTILAVAGMGGLGSSLLYLRLNARVVLSPESSREYLGRNSWNYIAYDNANRLLPPDARVAAEGVNNLYYLERPARSFPDSVPVSELQKQGFTHLLSVSDCPRKAVEVPGQVLWEGAYPWVASRLRGGIFRQVCARLQSIAPWTRR